MNLETNKNSSELLLEIEDQINNINSSKAISLKDINVKKSVDIFQNLNLKPYIANLDLENFTYKDLVNLSDRLNVAVKRIDKLREDIEIDEFFKNGHILDFEDLKKKFDSKNLQKKFKNFSWIKYKQFVKNAPLELLNHDNHIIKYDPFVIRKFIIAINQMVFDEMDLYVTTVGGEGSGKSCLSSQYVKYLYNFLLEVGLIEYAYDVKKLVFSNIDTFLGDEELQDLNDYFRIRDLDEAYGLNRQNFKDASSQIFKEDMRTTRKDLKIKFINLPQLGELDTSITLSRTNFIFYCTMDNDVKTGTLKKGIVQMYIIPRGRRIYSKYYKKELTRDEILNAFQKRMSKKGEYYLGMPKECMVHEFNFANVWGFDKDEYDEHVKTENKKRRLGGSIRTTDLIGYCLYEYLPELKFWKIDMKNSEAEKKAYYNLVKWVKGIKNKFDNNPDLYNKFKTHLSKETNKLKEKQKENDEKKQDNPEDFWHNMENN